MQEVVLFHTHGLGPYDFSVIEGQDLQALNELAERRHALLCPTVYLTEYHLDAFDRLIRDYWERKQQGELNRILGFSIEGPVLGPNGGTPSGSVWRPSVAQWRRIASWFPRGLKYIVAAPDLLALEDNVDESFTFAELLDLIYASGGRVALGHFEGASAQRSAERLNEVISLIEADYEPSPYLVLTDHLFNDMPRSFRHAFRTPTERVLRESELARHAHEPWQATSLHQLLGAVPAALLVAAREQRLTPALNFDAGHVDLEICRLVVQFLGAARVIAITDHTECLTLARERLHKDEPTKLLYRRDGVLAASSVTHEMQRANMQSIRMSESDIRLVQYETPLAALKFKPCRRSSLSAQG